MEITKKLINENPLIYFKVPGCSDCNKLNDFFKEINVTSCMIFDLSKLDDDIYEDEVTYIQTLSGTRKCPILFINGKYYGDYKKIINLYDVGELSNILKNELNIIIQDNDF